jgi:hypothetical protein
MKQTKFYSMAVLALMAGVISLTSCGSSNSAAKPKVDKNAIVLQENDKATLTVDDNYTTIVFPESLTTDDLALYNDDFMGYILKSNGPITTDGNSWGSYRIYYYLHNSKEWLFKGIYENPQEIQVSKIKKIRIAKSRKHLRDFVNEMPLLANSKEKKNDQGFQQEISSGSSYYIFIDIELKD